MSSKIQKTVETMVKLHTELTIRSEVLDRISESVRAMPTQPTTVRDALAAATALARELASLAGLCEKYSTQFSADAVNPLIEKNRKTYNACAKELEEILRMVKVNATTPGAKKPKGANTAVPGKPSLRVLSGKGK